MLILQTRHHSIATNAMLILQTRHHSIATNAMLILQTRHHSIATNTMLILQTRHHSIATTFRVNNKYFCYLIRYGITEIEILHFAWEDKSQRVLYYHEVERALYKQLK